MVWEIVFMLLILKIPIVYLCVVVWWAIKAEPLPAEPAALVPVDDTPPGGAPARSGTMRARRPARPRPSRRPGRSPRSARAEVLR